MEQVRQSGPGLLTEVEIRRNVFLPNVGCHCNDGGVGGDKTDAGRRRNAIEHGHDDVHEDEIVSHRLLVDLVYSFRTVPLLICQLSVTPARHILQAVTYGDLDRTIDVGQKLGSDPRACLVVLDQQYPRLPRSPQ